eukprot:1590915-Rhodomonas_salina.2
MKISIRKTIRGFIFRRSPTWWSTQQIMASYPGAPGLFGTCSLKLGDESVRDRVKKVCGVE